jgi:hypothetical protein
MKREKVRVVYISGFLMPNGWISYPSAMCDNEFFEIVPVFPSATGSMHDRVCEVFFELVGGLVDYGLEHSKFHKHNRYGRDFGKGKYPKWSESNPIIVIGHSMGSLTAWILQNYLSDNRFEGFKTNPSWIKAVFTINAPLNGTLSVYDKGLCASLPPMVRWGSAGYLIGLFAHIAEFFDSYLFRKLFDFGQGLNIFPLLQYNFLFIYLFFMYDCVIELFVYIFFFSFFSFIMNNLLEYFCIFIF